MKMTTSHLITAAAISSAIALASCQQKEESAATSDSSEEAGQPQAETMPAAEQPAEAANPDDRFIGMDQEAAGKLCEEENITYRIIEIDGMPQPATSDYQPERLNFAIAEGKITKVSRG